MKARRYLLLLRSVPYDGSRGQEALEMLMTLAAFEQTAAVLFLDESVWYLNRNQQPEILAEKNLAKLIDAAQIYGVGPFWVEHESLSSRGLRVEELAVPVQLLGRNQIPRLLADYDLLLGG